MLSFVKRPKAGKVETVVCRIIRGTTISGEARAKFVKVGDVVEIDTDTFSVLSGQGQAVKLTTEELAKLDRKKGVTDSAGNELTTR
jgi:hypothetical protein